MKAQHYICEKHSMQLLFTLRGGAGYCRRCAMYVQGVLGNSAKKVARPERKKKAA
ncbi:MAG: hypothetical protein MOB07_09585 [Acidobacteria bacterium]|nr:hypothetical protein [Acidobacteriota bacterium]